MEKVFSTRITGEGSGVVGPVTPARTGSPATVSERGWVAPPGVRPAQPALPRGVSRSSMVPSFHLNRRTGPPGRQSEWPPKSPKLLKRA